MESATVEGPSQSSPQVTHAQLGLSTSMCVCGWPFHSSKGGHRRCHRVRVTSDKSPAVVSYCKAADVVPTRKLRKVTARAAGDHRATCDTRRVWYWRPAMLAHTCYRARRLVHLDRAPNPGGSSPSNCTHAWSSCTPTPSADDMAKCNRLDCT